METNPSRKSYRGFKYSVLFLLVIVAIGFAWFSMNGKQSGDQQAMLKEKASSLTADAGVQGKNLMDKAEGIKTGIGDKIAEGREKVSTMASDVGDKAGEMAQAATDAGSDMVDRVKSATESSSDWVDRARSAIGNDESTELEHAEPSNDISEQASAAVSEGQSRIKTMMGSDSEPRMEEAPKAMTDTSSMSFKDDASMSFKDNSSGTMKEKASGSMSDATTAEAMSDRGESHMSAGTEKVSGILNKRMPGVSSDTQTAVPDQTASDMSDKPMANPTVDKASTDVQVPSGQSMAQKGNGAASPIRCIGTPPKGKDLGNQYIVAVCETMSIISERTGVGFEDLRNRNPQVQDPDLIFPNQRLWLPPRG